MHYIKRWKKFVLVSCSHGEKLCPSARYELLTFLDQYRPHLTGHLGDWIDTDALRAKGNHTEEASINLDMDAGFAFLREFHDYGSDYRYTFCGNHEDRIWGLLKDTRPLVRELAHMLLGDIQGFMGRIRSELFEYRDGDMWRLMGDTLIGHGTIYSENAARDTAESQGRSCIFGHSHRLMVASARTVRDAIGYNIGWLGDKRLAEYAKTRKQTKAWKKAFAWGEYCDTKTQVHIHRCREKEQTDEEIVIGQ